MYNTMKHLKNEFSEDRVIAVFKDAKRKTYEVDLVDELGRVKNEIRELQEKLDKLRDEGYLVRGADGQYCGKAPVAFNSGVRMYIQDQQVTSWLVPLKEEEAKERLDVLSFIKAQLHEYEIEKDYLSELLVRAKLAFTSQLNLILDDERIKWLGTERQLIYFIEALAESGLIQKDVLTKKYSVLKKHFVDREGREFKTKQMAASRASVAMFNKTNKPKDSDRIDQVLHETRKK